jgi:predicted acylesterase/phospholipase RssA/CRP-like cAMP-binding protein
VEQVKLLKRIPLFRNLDDSDLGLIATKLHRERYSKGVYVFNKGDFGDTLYLVDSGELAVVGDDGDQAIAFLGPGSFVGEISLLLAQPRTATLQVVIDAQLWALRKADFEALIRTRPAIALEMMREISRRLVKTTEQKAVSRKRRRITAVFGDLAKELALSIFFQIKSPVGFLPLSGAAIPADVTISGGLMMLGRENLDEAKLAESLSYQVGVFAHIVIALPDEPDPVTRKAISLADTVVSIGTPPAWFDPALAKCDFWLVDPDQDDLARLARRLLGQTVGLALSSGGSRGLAHLGVLKVLIEEDIPVDMVAGTSAGALFGALYVLGWDVERLTDFAKELKLATHWRNWDFNIPPLTALVKGKVARNKLIGKWVENKSFEDLETPMYMVAADAYTGEEVVYDSGPLADAIRASLSIPFVAEPWHYQGRYLIDGGIVNPLPASVLRDRGADIVIASSVVQPLVKTYRGSTDKVPNIMQTVSNMFSAMEAEVISKQFPLIDVLVQHDVAANHALDFDQADVLIDIGVQSARQMLPAIQKALKFSVRGA